MNRRAARRAGDSSWSGVAKWGSLSVNSASKAVLPSTVLLHHRDSLPAKITKKIEIR